MSLHFDSATARVRLDEDGFSALLAHANAEPISATATRELRDSGVLSDAGLDRRVLPGLGAIIDPVCEGALQILDDKGKHLTGHLWISPTAATFLLDSVPGMRDLIAVGPGFFPVSVAQAVGLGPRPRLEWTRTQMSAQAFDGIAEAHPGMREREAARVRFSYDDPVVHHILDLLTAGRWQLWSLQLQWEPTPDAEGMRGIQIFDTSQGILRVEADTDETLEVISSTPTEVWEMLTLMLPSDGEVAMR